jgi:hypothetical protein
MRTPLLLAATLLVVYSYRADAQTSMYDGRPTFSEGVDLGYYIWKDGDQWNVRWTTRGTMRRFTGSVVADAGELESLKRIDVESESKVLYPGRARHVVVGPRGRARVTRGRAPVVVTKEQDKIEKDGDRRIVFNALTNDDIDGFSFKVDGDPSELRFFLQVDGKPARNLIEVGKNNEKPVGPPLVVQLK